VTNFFNYLIGIPTNVWGFVDSYIKIFAPTEC
jgi:hypothetical protein